MTVLGVIPARMGSSRYPGKPLAELAGRTMIEHVFVRSRACADLDEVVVATCDAEIKDAAEAFGARVVMTSSEHERATDRSAEAAAAFAADLVVMIQGDEPLVHPDALTALCRALVDDPTVSCANLANVIESEEDYEDPGQIKVVCDPAGDALYMSRRPIPRLQPFRPGMVLRQTGLIGFRSDALARFAALAPTPLEIAESIDMLRFLEHRMRVRMIVTAHVSFGVDTPDDLAAAEAALARGPDFSRNTA